MTNLILQKLLLAICLTESAGDPLAFNHDDGKGLNNHSFGFCQVGYQTARLLGMKKQNSCESDLRLPKLRSPSRCQLFDKKVNMFYASLYLNRQLKRYNNDIKKSVSAYNAGKAITKNKLYVKKVLKRFKEIQNAEIYSPVNFSSTSSYSDDILDLFLLHK